MARRSTARSYCRTSSSKAEYCPAGLADEQGVVHADRASLANLSPGGGKSSSIDMSWSDANFACVTHDHHSVRTNLRSLRICDHSESAITQNLRSLICPAYHDQCH